GFGTGAIGGAIGGAMSRDASGRSGLKHKVTAAASNTYSGALSGASFEYNRTSRILRSEAMPRGLRSVVQDYQVVNNRAQWEEDSGEFDEAARLLADQASANEGDYEAISQRAYENFGLDNPEDDSKRTRKAVRAIKRELDKQDREAEKRQYQAIRENNKINKSREA